MKLFISLIFVISTASSAFSTEFKHFKLKGLLKQKDQSENSQTKRVMESSVSLGIDDALYDKIFGRKIIQEGFSKSTKEEAPSPFENSLLFKKIIDMLKGSYDDIGKTQAQTLLKHKQDFGGGVENFSGFSWEKPAGTFSIGVNRQLSPDLFNSERWIVHDTFVISIDATTFLNKLSQENLIAIDAGVISAFAGVTWQRVYSTYHFSSSFASGIMADFSKLFMPFIYFNPNKIADLPQDEILMMEDYFSFRAGGIVTTPPVYGFSFSAGAHMAFSKTSKVSIQSLGIEDPRDKDEFLRVTTENIKSKAVGAAASVQLDFFNILKLTLLSAELTYELEQSQKNHLKFYWEDIPQITAKGSYSKEFKKLLKGKFIDIDFFTDRVVGHEERLSENLTSRYGILTISKMKRTDTDYVRIVKGDESKTFFNHHSENIKVVQSFFSKLFSVFINQKLDFDVAVRNNSLSLKSIDIEYESNKKENDMIVDDEEKFSILITHQYQAAKVHKKKFFNKKARYFLERYTPLGREYSQLIKDKKLESPVSFESMVRVQKEGLYYFHHLSDSKVFYTIAKNCGMSSSQARKYASESYRRRYLRRWRVGKKACVKSTGNLFYDYISGVREKGTMNLKKLKAFLTKFYKKNENYRYFLDLFGEDKVFVHGSLEAITDQGLPFQTYFKNGEFKGYGVIDNYRKKN